MITVQSWEQALSGDAVAQLARVLPDYLTGQRWYRAKARTIRQVRIEDVIQLERSEWLAAIVTVEYTQGESDIYFLPLAIAADGPPLSAAEMVTKLRSADGGERSLYGALSNAAFRDALLNAVACNQRFEGGKGELAASRTSALDRDCDAREPRLESFVSRAEQSNSSVIFGDRYILKVFRKLEAGINPDLEVGRFLTERKFPFIPAVLGEVLYRPRQGDPMQAAILQAFVRNQGDAWKYTLESLSGFFERALQNDSVPQPEKNHPLNLCDEELPALARQTIGDYVESARLLGTRTGQMHVALADHAGGPDFAPQVFAPKDADALYSEMIKEADRAFSLLKDKHTGLKGDALNDARALLAMESQVRQRLSLIRDRSISAVRIRHHGDYHLGQVLYTGEDFVIIDFEGEPARPLAERRTKTLAMRDVAGMVRSFSYAGHAALFGQVAGVPTTPDARAQVEPWASYWAAWVSAVYLKGYFEAAAGEPFTSADDEERQLVFDAFVLQKALYEVAYELNNRPDWVEIPLRGILNLIS
jgi:trehalose synthase-fused probable maltokinase